MNVRPLHRLALLVAAGTLAGCAVGPNYQAPQPVMPPAFVATTVPATGPATPSATPPPTQAAAPPATQPATQPSAADLAHWWTAFNDPTLNGLIAQALQTNLDLQQAESRLVQARAACGVVSADFWPNVTGSGNYTRARTPITNDKGVTSNSFNAAFDAAWEIDIFGGVRRNVEAAKADIQAAVEDRRAVLVTVTAEVAVDYINLRAAQHQLAVVEDNLVAQDHSLQITRQKQQAGFVSSLDVSNAEAQVASTRAQLPVLQNAVAQNAFALGVLLACNPEDLLKELSAPDRLPPAPPLIPTGLPAELLRRRPDIRRSEAQIHGATARIGVATADLFPKISLTGSLGLESQQLLSLTNAGSRFWTLGPTVSWPVFDAGKIFSNIKVQDALTRQAFLTYQQTVLTALQDVDTALVACAREKEHHVALAQAETANRKAVATATTLYANGQTDFLNVLSAQGALFAAQTALVQSSQNLDQDIIALYKALGGGWQEDVPPAPAAPPRTKPQAH